MRFKQIVETTTAGSVATVAQPMMTQTRENTNVKGLKPVQQVMKGAKKKGPYANSIVESKVTEDDLAEQDLIVIPGQGRLRRTGFVKHDLDQGEHEGHTLKNSLHTIARAASDLDKRLSVQSEFPEWVSEKIGAAKGMMVTVMDYLISSQEMQHDSDAINEGEVSTSNLRTMYDLARMAKNYCNPEGQESLNELLKILKWYMDQAEQNVTEGSQRVDSIVTDALRVMKGPEVSDAVLALKRVLGDRAYNERRGFYSFYIDQIHDMYNQQNINELSSGLLGRAAQAATDKRNQAMEPKLHDALGGGYMNPLAKHYDNVSQKMDNRAGQVRKKETIQNIASKIASPAVMRKIGMSGMAEGKVDFAKKLQGKVDNHNKAVVKTKKAVGSRVADIGAGGKEHNVKTDAAWDAAKKKVSEGSKK